MRVRSTTVRHKFKAVAVQDDGHYFASKLEWSYYRAVLGLQKAGHLLFFLRQVPFHLPGGVKYVCDYQLFFADGTIEFVDVKGVMTPLSKLKIKQVEELYPVKIKIVKKGDF